MKQILIALFALHTYYCAAQVCEPNGISTNPLGPVNPNAPSNRWLNTFNWCEVIEESSLVQYAIYDMFGPQAQILMSHPYSDAQPYTYLWEHPINLLDMYPEDGWEILSINLGHYPNGEILTQLPSPEQSLFAEIPYILLYNKQRGILRIFANSLTGLSNPNIYDTVIITLEFVANEGGELNGYSGLLRLNGGKDLALDQQTKSKKIFSAVAHPTNSMSWFHTDFQVGYDPCTCMYRSDLRLNFNFIANTSINLASRGIYTEPLPLIDANGHTTIPRDFLATVNYSNGFDGTGITIYQTMNKMLNDYLVRLDYVEAYNTQAGITNAEIKKKKAILNTLKSLAVAGATGIVTDALATQVSTFASEIVQTFYSNGSVKISKDKLQKEATKVLGKGFDWFSSQWIGAEQDLLPSPTMPTASISESTFSGELVVAANVTGPRIFNPGTYPNATGNLALNVHNYPIYNEILGTFALLNSPNFEYSTGTDYQSTTVTELIDSYSIPSPYDPQATHYPTTFKAITSTSKNIRFKLKDEVLNYCFNKAVPIDLQNVEIEAAVVVDGDVPFTAPPIMGFSSIGEISTSASNTVFQASVDESAFLLMHPNNLHYDASLNNLLFEGINGFHGENKYHFESNFIALENFNNQVFDFYLTYDVPWRGQATNDWSNTTPQIIETAFANYLSDQVISNMFPEQFRLTLKLAVKMPFTTPGHNGEKRSTTQIFTFDIRPEDLEFSSSTIDIPWSVTDNPNPNGSLALNEDMTFYQKQWEINDYTLYGGVSVGSGNTSLIVRPHALNTIQISGNQTISSSLTEVNFKAGQEIEVSGDVLIPSGFVLQVEEFVNLTATENPPVSDSFINSFCRSELEDSYKANERRSGAVNTGYNTIANVKNNKDKAIIDLNIYPVPANEILKVSSQGLFGSILFKVFDTNGRVLLTEFSNTSTTDLNLITLQPGVYNLQAIDANGLTLSKQFVVYR